MNEYENIKHEINILKSIESIYILRDIFSFLPERLKLNIIIYNKNLQKKLDNINIEDYKRVSGIYREGERNGKGEEYDKLTNIMIFEGEYLNGKRNGKGKEYEYDDNLNFEIEILKGKLKCKGKLKFEGEFLNGKKWNGKGYNKEGKIDYEINKGNGKIKEYYDNGGLKFEGQYLNGKIAGNIKEYYIDGKLRFEGEYLNEKKWNGKGYNEEGKIDFEINEGTGKIKEYYDNGKLKYEGEYFKD